MLHGEICETLWQILSILRMRQYDTCLAVGQEMGIAVDNMINTINMHVRVYNSTLLQWKDRELPSSNTCYVDEATNRQTTAQISAKLNLQFQVDQ